MIFQLLRIFSLGALITVEIIHVMISLECLRMTIGMIIMIGQQAVLFRIGAIIKQSLVMLRILGSQ